MPLPDPHIVTTGDGKMFRCVVEPKIGLDGRDHWVFTEADGTRHVGPAYRPVAHIEELRGVVYSWWAIERANRMITRIHEDTIEKIAETRRRIDRF